MLGIVDSIRVILFLGVLLFWPGFLLQFILVDSKDFLETCVFSTAFGLAFLAIICPVLDLIWNISVLSVFCSVILLSFLFLLRKPQKLPFKGKWEAILIFVLAYGFLLRSSTLFDSLPRGQDAWVHISFIQYIYEMHSLPQTIPWREPVTAVTLYIYPPGAHCIAALLSEAAGEVSYAFLKVVFIVTGAGSALSSYVGSRRLFGEKVAVLSAACVAIFMPHMIMTSEITAQAISIFLYPLVVYLFYRGKWIPSGILFGAVILIHHVSAFALGISLGVAVLTLSVKKVKYLLTLLGACGISLGVSAPWWSRVSVTLVEAVSQIGYQSASALIGKRLFDPYTGMVSPLFIILSMIGFVLLLKKRTENAFFIIAWALVLFIASQPVFPIVFLSWRFPAFFVFPCSVMTSLGLLELRKYLKKIFFVLLLLLVFSGHFLYSWPTTGEENLVANEWIQDSLIDPVFYAYGPNYIYIYPLSHQRIYEIRDYDNPFNYETEASTYFYDDSNWVPHDVNRFGEYDKIYSCLGVVIHRIT
jgi:hypothetical protein